MGFVEFIAFVTIGSLSWLLGFWMSPERREGRGGEAPGRRVRSLEVYRTLRGRGRPTPGGPEQGRVIPMQPRRGGARGRGAD
jgi:hypothetical protein